MIKTVTECHTDGDLSSPSRHNASVLLIGKSLPTAPCLQARILHPFARATLVNFQWPEMQVTGERCRFQYYIEHCSSCSEYLILIFDVIRTGCSVRDGRDFKGVHGYFGVKRSTFFFRLFVIDASLRSISKKILKMQVNAPRQAIKLFFSKLCSSRR